ncbi:hypothetical protein [Accumulibacter sp.]|uniref:type IV pilus assembly protein FimV n=1 Tax=Accumulibacter sp. TaxID=2053492 RepID=UPI0025FA259F|nr:hypothetical protein [Accumulibacter sp.]MCM8611321.1 hypothetical protein [Accumulibacter sp.]MCM8635032.1 hypothetical protein [Accumulibacter sp.]MCM8639820.1 hypothetical protein [Accumulibacter sp.]
MHSFLEANESTEKRLAAPVRADLMRAGVPFLILLLAVGGSPSHAIMLGELRSSARVGQVLQAEIEVNEHPAERFDPACLKLFRPQSASDDLPWITDARLSYRREGGQGRLSIVSRAAIADPAVRLAVRSECASTASREYTILLADPTGALAAAPVRSPVAPKASAQGNGTLGALPDAPRPADALPPRRSPATTGEGGRAARGSPAKGEAAPLVSSDELSEPVPASELGRELLRLEQRALAMLNDPADDQEAMSNKLAWLEANVAELKRAAEKLQGGAAALPGGDAAGEPRPSGAVAGSAGSPPGAAAQGAAPSAAANTPASAASATNEPPRVVRTQPAAPATAEEEHWLFYGLLVLVLLVALFLFRRHRNATVEQLGGESEQAAAGTTNDRHQFSLTPAAAAAVPIEAPQRRTAVPLPAHVPAPVPLPAPVPVAATVAPAVAEGGDAAPPTVAAALLPPDQGLGGASPAIELAEIMLSFGRVSGAARTLEEYIAALPQESARPWIRLLHLYQRNGMREEFEALTVKLNRNFNVEILAWENEKVSGELELIPLAGAAAKARTLEDVPRLRDEIVALWGKPECLGYLENLLRDNRQGKRKGFPLPVAEEILFLIDLAAAREVSH